MLGFGAGAASFNDLIEMGENAGVDVSWVVCEGWSKYCLYLKTEIGCV
jgi:hypothetical protein